MPSILNNYSEDDSFLRQNIKNYKKIKSTKFHKDIFFNHMLQCINKDQLPAQLIQNDNVSMYYSLECRSPFLSKQLFEYLYSLPKDFFMFNGIPKNILRSSFEDELPKIIINDYKKVGFYNSLTSFFSKNDFKKIRKYILNSKILKKIIKLNNLENYLNNITLKKNSNTIDKLIFSMLNIAILEEVLNR